MKGFSFISAYYPRIHYFGNHLMHFELFFKGVFLANKVYKVFDEELLVFEEKFPAFIIQKLGYSKNVNPRSWAMFVSSHFNTPQEALEYAFSIIDEFIASNPKHENNVETNLAINNFIEILVELKDYRTHYLINDFDDFEAFIKGVNVFIAQYEIIDETFFPFEPEFSDYVQRLLPMYSKSKRRRYDIILKYVYPSAGYGKEAGFKHLFRLLFSPQQQNLKKT